MSGIKKHLSKAAIFSWKTGALLVGAAILFISQYAAASQDIDVRAAAPLQSNATRVDYNLALGDCSTISQIDINTALGINTPRVLPRFHGRFNNG